MQGQQKQCYVDAVKQREKPESSGGNKTREVQNQNNNKIKNDKYINVHQRRINCFRCGSTHELRKSPEYGKLCLKCGTKIIMLNNVA